MRCDGPIMVGVVGDAPDRIVLGWAAEEALRSRADLLVCHVRERGERSPAHAAGGEPAGSAELLVREAADTARGWLPELSVRTAVGTDRVVGARGLGGFERLRIGSVSQHVLRHAPCTILVAR